MNGTIGEFSLLGWEGQPTLIALQSLGEDWRFILIRRWTVAILCLTLIAALPCLLRGTVFWMFGRLHMLYMWSGRTRRVALHLRKCVPLIVSLHPLSVTGQSVTRSPVATYSTCSDLSILRFSSIFPTLLISIFLVLFWVPFHGARYAQAISLVIWLNLMAYILSG